MGDLGRKRFCWIFPDRSSTRQRRAEWEHYWANYTNVAASMGFSLEICSPEAIEVVSRPPEPLRVLVWGEPVRPETTVFVTDLYLMPYQVADGVAQLLTFQALELAGFYLPIPPALSLIMNDKLATHALLRDGPLTILPSVRVQTGRDVGDHDVERLLAGLSLPAVVKPATWGTGIGVTLARTAGDVRALLTLASGAEAAMTVQPFLGWGVVDHRVYVIDGRPQRVLTRSPAEGELVGNTARGGTARFVDLPAALEAPVRFAVERLGVPYFCMDFLYDGERFWFSEIELDGGIGRISLITQEQTEDILRARFTAYDRAHERWLASRSEPAGTALAHQG